MNVRPPYGPAPGRKMPNEDLIRMIASRAWSEVLREKSRELAEDVAKKMGVALASQVSQASQPSQPDRCRELRDGAMLIAGSKTQTATLEALLTASSALTPACGLLVLRGSQAGGQVPLPTGLMRSGHRMCTGPQASG